MIISYTQYIITFILGLLTGFINGITGITNMVIVLGFLSFFNILKDYQMVVGTGLYILMFPITALAVLEYYKNSKINFVIGNIVVVGLIIGSYFGARFAFKYSHLITEKVIKYITGVIAICAGISFVSSAYHLK